MLEITLSLPTGEKDGEGNEINKDKTYVAPTPKARMVRRAMEIVDHVNFNDLKPADLDYMINYAIDLFHNQFTIDDVYDGLEADQLIPTLQDCINNVVNKMGAKLQQFPNVPAGQ